MNPPKQIPGRMAALEELLHGQLGLQQFGIEGRVHTAPKIGKDRGCQIFRPGHGRNRRRQRIQLAIRRDRHGWLGMTFSDARNSAQGGHVAQAKLSPI